MPDLADRFELAVVVISFRAQPGLTASIRSILAQDIATELVVVNSGGGDVMAHLPAGAENVRVITTAEVLWPGAARNRGIAATRAPFIAFLAADCIADAGWVAARLQRHRRGAAAVASAVLNSDPDSVVATAYHLTNMARRDPSAPPLRASRYGASYARWLFDRYGLFRADLRVAEDSEFNSRLDARERPVWAPEVGTIHRNGTRLLPALREHFQRGALYGRHWPQPAPEWFVRRVPRLIRVRQAERRALLPPPRSGGAVVGPLLLALSILANQLGRSVGRRKALPAARIEMTARRATARRDWPASLAAWGALERLLPDNPYALIRQAEALGRAGRFPEAAAKYAELVRRAPEDVSLHVARARAALAEGELEQAGELWQQAADRFGRRLPILEGQALTLAAAGRYAEANAVFAELAAAFPYSSIGAWGRADIAVATQQWSAGLAMLDAIWMRFSDARALEQRAGVLLHLDRQPELDATIALLGEIESERPRFLIAALDDIRARSDWGAMLDLVRRHERDIAAQLPLLRRFVTALCIAGETDVARALIALNPKINPAQRALLLIATLLHDGRQEAAWRAYAEVASRRRGGEMGTATFMTLASLANRIEGPDAVAALVAREAHAGASPALRIAGIFVAARSDSLAQLSVSPPRLDAPDPALEDRIASAPSAAHDPAPLETCRQVVLRLRTEHPAFAPDPSYVLADAVTVAVAIIAAVREQRPFSLVRLGDGEGNMLPYRAEYAAFQEADGARVRRIWWGGDAVGPEAGLGPALRRAIDDADIVGIPDLLRLSNGVTADTLGSLQPRGRNARGVLAAFDYGVGRREALLTSCHVHQALAYWGLWDVLLPQFGIVSLVTCHAELGPALASRFGLGIAATHLVPPEFKHAAKFDTRVGGRHYPERFEQLRATLSATPRGHVVLVAAGMLGKIYCDWIKGAGGIALDVGSAADNWCGYHTRSPEENASYTPPDGQLARLQALAEHDARVAFLMGSTTRG